VGGVSVSDSLYERQKRYYDLRAPEYDRRAWEPETALQAAEHARIVDVLTALPPARTLDVGCGTGLLTQHLRGEITLLDASEAMLRLAGERVPHARRVHAEAPPLPFAASSFDRVFSSHFFDHLEAHDRQRFLLEARRVAAELVLVQQAGTQTHREGREVRVLENGSTHEIYKVYFTPETLHAEVGGGEFLHSGSVFMVLRRSWGDPEGI
jgi:demethylmenaquinone methyltransferase/2-methoxy-6-polyprenyl-1,4-benzoquinol methylase